MPVDSSGNVGSTILSDPTASTTASSVVDEVESDRKFAALRGRKAAERSKARAAKEKAALPVALTAPAPK